MKMCCMRHNFTPCPWKLGRIVLHIDMKLGRVRHNFIFECEAISVTQLRFPSICTMQYYSLAFVPHIAENGRHIISNLEEYAIYMQSVNKKFFWFIVKVASKSLLEAILSQNMPNQKLLFIAICSFFTYASSSSKTAILRRGIFEAVVTKFWTKFLFILVKLKVIIIGVECRWVETMDVTFWIRMES